MPVKSKAACIALSRTSDSPLERLEAVVAIVLAICKLEDRIGVSATEEGTNPPKIDSGAISDSIGIAHGGGRTSTKAVLLLKQRAAMIRVRMFEIFIVFL